MLLYLALYWGVFVKYYLAYGSSLNLKQMNLQCRDARCVGRTFLDGYKLAFRGLANGFSYLTLEECVGSRVPVGIYEVSKNDEIALDKGEGYKEFYYKDNFEIDIFGIKQKAIIYLLSENCAYNVPSFEYLKTCVDGYKDFGFNIDPIIEAYNYSLDKYHSRTRKKTYIR